MQSTNSHQGSKSDNGRWYLLGEYSFSGLILDPEQDPQRAIELPSAVIDDIDIPLERVGSIEVALRSFAGQALRHAQPDGQVHPGKIRIFCQKKILDEEMKGGWGYFVIEKPREAFPEASQKPPEAMDLYIYEEG